MGIPSYIKMEAEEAILILDERIVAGYQLKDLINQDYDRSRPPISEQKVQEWNRQLSEWSVETIGKLQDIFVSPKEAYNFRDAPVSPLMIVGTNMQWNNVVNKFDARIQKLNEYDESIRHNFKVNVEIVGRDKITQIGNDNAIKTKN